MKTQTRQSFSTYFHEVEFQSTFSNTNTIIQTIALRTVSKTVTWQVLQAFGTTSSRYENRKSFYWHNPADKSSSPEVRLIFTRFVQSIILSAIKFTVDFVSEEDLTSGLIQLNAWSSHKNVVVGHFHLASMIHLFQGSWHSETFVRHTWVTDTAHRDFLHKASITATCAEMQNASRKDSLEPLQQTTPCHFGSFSRKSNSCKLHYINRPACSYMSHTEEVSFTYRNWSTSLLSFCQSPPGSTAAVYAMVERPKSFSLVTFDKSHVVPCSSRLLLWQQYYNASKLPMYDFNHGFLHPHQITEKAALFSAPVQ